MKLRLRFVIGLLMSCFVANSFAQSYDEKVESYINQYKDIAILEMQRTGIPASITLGQGIIESGAGLSPLATEANNHFGIKCHDTWDGETYTYDDDKKNECFRKYASAKQSFDDHSDFLKTRGRYAILFTYDSKNYKAWAKGLKSCGYATNPQYANILIKCIEDYDLHQWDLSGQEREEWFATINKTKSAEFINSKDEGLTANGSNKIELPSAKDLPAQRVYVFNDIKCVTLDENETLNSLATNFEIGINRLKRYNDIYDDSQVRAGDRIYLQPKRNNGDQDFHVVSNGETMFTISRDHGIQLRELYEKNLMEIGSQPVIGETLYLRKTRDSLPLITDDSAKGLLIQPAQNSFNVQIHQVAKGDTLYSISKKYDIDVADLKKINHLSSNDLRIGDRLKVTK